MRVTLFNDLNEKQLGEFENVVLVDNSLYDTDHDILLAEYDRASEAWFVEGDVERFYGLDIGLAKS